MSVPDALYTLYFGFGRTHFLINRSQAPASVYAEHPELWDSGYPYFEDKLGMDGGREIPLFDLHGYLTNLFRLEGDSQALLILLVPLRIFDGSSAAQLREGPLKNESGAGNPDFQLGIRVSSETVIRSIPLAELAPHSRLLRRRLKEAGLLAVHPREESMGHLVDLGRAAAAAAREDRAE